jgi:hypothetical protein
MTIEWMKLAMATVLLGTVALSACTTMPASNTRSGAADLQDPASDNTESVPFDAWFKDRPQ